MSSIQHILLDIEGTTCPVSFVSEVLFPYAAREVGAYLERNATVAEIQSLIRELMVQWQGETDEEISRLRASCMASDARDSLEIRVLPYIHWLIRTDRKVSAWKDLQGRIWQEGYARGELKAELFAEVATTLRAWERRGMQMSVYSSGSVPAQKLLYGYSSEGDLRPLFSHWFDTRIGAKQEEGSYRAIVEVIDRAADEVLFISDSVAELEAARRAGLQVLFSDREGNPRRDPEGFPAIRSLEQVRFERT